AAALAAKLHSSLLDLHVPRLLSSESALATLPTTTSPAKFSDWVGTVGSVEESGGIWISTNGMSRMGLPELQVHRVPPPVSQAMADALLGIAWRVAKQVSPIAQSRDPKKSIKLASPIELNGEDVAYACHKDIPHDRHAQFSLRFDKGNEE